MSEIVSLLKTGWTPGAVGVWVWVFISAGMLWKGLPGLLDAWTRRQDKEAERVDREFARLANQITASDQRHAECEKRCQALQQQVEGLMRQFRQMQLSAVRVGVDTAEPPIIQSLLSAIDKPVTGDLS